MAFIVVYDSNVLYSSVLRDILIRVGMQGLVRARWTDRILDEVFDNLHKNRPDIPQEKLARTRMLMNSSIREVRVSGYEALEGLVLLPDPKDHHVLAAAIKTHAQMIVTANLKDFPPEELAKWDVEAKHPDDFLVDQFHLDPIAMHVIAQQMADDLGQPSMTQAEVLDSLAKSGVPQTAALLRR